MNKTPIDVKTAINLALVKFRQKYGDSETLSEGESYAVAFENCILVIGMKQGVMIFEFVGGDTLYINESVDETIFMDSRG